MNFSINWVLGLFKKPEVEVLITPTKVEKKKPAVKKATTRKPAVKKAVAKKATKVVKKAK